MTEPTEPKKKEFVISMEVETKVKAEDYETAVVHAYNTVKGGTIHITKIKEIKPIEPTEVKP
jgi:hypothetical protein